MPFSSRIGAVDGSAGMRLIHRMHMQPFFCWHGAHFPTHEECLLKPRTGLSISMLDFNFLFAAYLHAFGVEASRVDCK